MAIYTLIHNYGIFEAFEGSAIGLLCCQGVLWYTRQESYFKINWYRGVFLWKIMYPDCIFFSRCRYIDANGQTRFFHGLVGAYATMYQNSEFETFKNFVLILACCQCLKVTILTSINHSPMPIYFRIGFFICPPGLLLGNGLSSLEKIIFALVYFGLLVFHIAIKFQNHISSRMVVDFPS
jgi:hypothetical protein